MIQWFRQLIFFLVLPWTLHAVDPAEFASRNVGYLEGLLPGIIFLKQEIEAMSTSSNGRFEAMHSLRTWSLRWEQDIQKTHQLAGHEWTLAPLERLYEQLDPIAYGPDSEFRVNRSLTPKGVAKVLKELESFIAYAKGEIKNPDYVLRRSPIFLEATALGFMQSSLNMFADIQSDSGSINRRKEDRHVNLFLTGIDLTRIKMEGARIALSMFGLPGNSGILQEYSEKLAALRTQFPRPKWFVNSDYREDVKNAAFQMKEFKREFNPRFFRMTDLDRDNLIDGLTSSKGSCRLLLSNI